MRRLLLVKTSSLGDVVHNLPVVTDLRNRYPDLEIDWAVEESFAEIPILHPAVCEVVPVAPRRWRKNLVSRSSWQEMGALRRRLRARQYDAVLDTQGLLKSAVIARMAPGRRFGLDWSSSREPIWPFYDQTLHISWSLHAVERNRQFAAQALGYALTSEVDYGISGTMLGNVVQDSEYAVLLHATSAREKLWPEHQWVKLADHLRHRGLSAVLPWGNEEERRRSEEIARLLKHATVPPRLSLSEVTALLAGARVVFGVDTGLTHLAVALGKPTVGIYSATDPAATGLYGSVVATNVGGKSGPPPVTAVIAAWHRVQPGTLPAQSPA